MKSYGYPVEVHEVTTSDGYVLTLFRIPYGKSGPTNCIRPVAFLQHGLLGSSDTFLANLPHESLGDRLFIDILIDLLQVSFWLIVVMMFGSGMCEEIDMGELTKVWIPIKTRSFGCFRKNLAAKIH